MKIPSISKILKIYKDALPKVLTKISRDFLQDLRSNNFNLSEEEIIKEIGNRYEDFKQKEPRSLINASGIIIHTNLGRSPLDKDIFNEIHPLLSGYCNLEYDIKNAKRSDRYVYLKDLLCSFFDCEDALVVNNNAASVFLILNTFAKNKNALISRGELVEIGGNFRIPDVMKEAGVKLKEIGTTNKTNLSDYENAIGKKTAMILKVHRSNFEISGFASSANVFDLSKLAKKHSLNFYYDLGAGYEGDIGNLGKDEPSVKKLLSNGVDLLSFSGDKLFGSVQSGIILGKRNLIQKLRNNQLLRMLRLDKISIIFLIKSLEKYLKNQMPLTMKMINRPLSEIENLAKYINENLNQKLEIIQTKSFVGGGSLPNKYIKSVALAMAKNKEEVFRNKGVIGRIENDKFLLDLRSILQDQENDLIKIINEINL